jgi:hypothetical protein
MKMEIVSATGGAPMSDYEFAWQKCRSLTNQFVFALVVQILIVAASIHYSGAIRRNFAPTVALQLAWVVVVFVTGIRLQIFRCPRCGEKFFVSPAYYHNVFARRCLNCGLPKYSS